MKTTAYYIKLEANLSARHIYYIAFWDGCGYRTSSKPWVCYDKLPMAQAEFSKALISLKPEHYSGCYQVGIWAEEWQDDSLINSGYIETYQTPAFNALKLV